MEIIECTIEKTLLRIKEDSIWFEEDLTAAQVQSELNVGNTAFYQKFTKGKHAIPFGGTPKKRKIKRSDFEKWKKEHWGKY